MEPLCPSPKPIPPPSLLSMATKPRKTRGRQKVELKRIENEDARYVTFSKRKLSLFKKAAELATLCGAEIALVVFSPAGRPYSLGLPTIDEVFHRVLSSGPAQVGSQMAGHSVVSPSAEQCSEVAKHLEQERSRKAVLAKRLQMAAPPRWEGGLDGLGWDELLAQVKEVQELKSKVDSRVGEVLLQGSSSSTNPIATADAWPVGGSAAHPQYRPGVFVRFDHGGW